SVPSEPPQRAAEQLRGVEPVTAVAARRLDGSRCGLLRPAQSHESLDHVGVRAADGRGHGRGGARGGGGRGGELPAELEQHPPGDLRADARGAGDGLGVLLGDRAPQLLRVEHREHRESGAGPDAGDRLDDAEGLGLLGVREPVEGQRVLADDQLGVEGELGAVAGRAERLRGGADEVADAADLEHEGVEVDAGDTAGQGCDHPASLEHLFDQWREVERSRARRASRSARAQIAWALVRAPPVASSATGPGPRHSWVSAIATASEASAGCGATSRPSRRISIVWICFLSARPLPVTAAFTSEGVWSAVGMPRSAASSSAIPETWAVPITVEMLFWLKTRSTATASGANSSSAARSPRAMASSRRSS